MTTIIVDDEIVLDPDWREHAACRGLPASIFFFQSYLPRRDANPVKLARARQICNTCPVKLECLEYALDNPREEGIWAGTTEKDRRNLRRKRRRNVRQPSSATA